MSPVQAGSRLTPHAPAVVPTLWKCPACGVENVSLIGTPCTSCGAGEVGQHLDPPPATSTVPTVLPEIAAAFQAWLHPLRGRVDDVQETLLFEAFKAGYHFRGEQVAEPLRGTAETRTIAAALKLFVDQVLTYAKVEVESGEFLSVAATQALIQKFDR